MTLSLFEIILIIFSYILTFFLIFTDSKEIKYFQNLNLSGKILIIILLLTCIPFLLAHKLAKVLNCLSNE